MWFSSFSFSFSYSRGSEHENQSGAQLFWKSLAPLLLITEVMRWRSLSSPQQSPSEHFQHSLGCQDITSQKSVCPSQDRFFLGSTFAYARSYLATAKTIEP